MPIIFTVANDLYGRTAGDSRADTADAGGDPDRGLGGQGLTRFVGRRREMEALREAFDKAREGSGQVVGIAGEAGKTLKEANRWQGLEITSRTVDSFRDVKPMDLHTAVDGLQRYDGDPVGDKEP